MLKKTITYTDYNGTERTEEFRFNLSKAELTEMELTTPGGLVEMINEASNTQNVPTLYKIFKDIVLKAYGEKTSDGKYFRKLDENGKPLYIEFAQTEAYSELMTELTTDADAAAAFVNGIIPAADKTPAVAPAAN